MATHTTQLHTGFPANTDRTYRILELVVDFSKQNVTAADVVNVWTIPTDAHVLWMNWEVITDAGTTCTFDIGDGDSATTWFSNGNLNQAAGTVATVNTTAKLYSSGGTLKVTADHTNAVGKFRILAAVADCSTQYTMAG